MFVTGNAYLSPKLTPMKSNETVIEEFYTAFKNKNIKYMQNCYSEEAVFNDPVFSNLSAKEVRSMWEMLIKSGKDMRVEFNNIKANQAGGTAEWHAYYTFSATGKKVINHVHSSFIIGNAKIVKHTDSFDFYKWAGQAFGLKGLMLGWTGFFKAKVSKTASHKLKNYMER